MRGLRWLDDIVKTGSWTCHRCPRGRQKPVAHLAAYLTNPGKSPPRTLFAQTAFHPRRILHESTILRDFTLEKAKDSSLSSNKSTWKKVPVLKGKRCGVVLALLAIGSIWAFSDDAKHRCVAAKRAMRVFYTLVRCLSEQVLTPLVRHLQ